MHFPSHKAANKTPLKKQRTLDRDSEIRGSQRLSLNEDDLASLIDKALENIGGGSMSSPISFKEGTKTRWLDTLEAFVDRNVSDIPRLGFSSSQILVKSSRTQRRALQVLTEGLYTLATLLCPDSPSVLIGLMLERRTSAQNSKRDADKVVENLIDMLFFANDRDIRTVAGSALANAIERSDLVTIMKEMLEVKSEKVRESIEIRRKEMGKDRFSTLRKAYDAIISGQSIPKKVSASHINPQKLEKAVDFIQTTLQCIPGKVRDVNFGNLVFEHMPVYSRGGLTHKVIFEQYKLNVGVDELSRRCNGVGKDAFKDLVNIMCRKGEHFSGLSTFFISLRYASIQMQAMLTRILSLPFKTNDLYNQHQLSIQTLQKEWQEIYMFLNYEYYNVHLGVNNTDSAHCCVFGIGGKCVDHQHPDVLSAPFSDCKKCSLPFQFATRTFPEYLKRLTGDLDISGEDEESNQSLKEEVESMQEAADSLFQVTRTFAAHKARAKIQFAAIKEIKKQLLLDDTLCLIVLDHKQKILPADVYEGQV